MKKLEGWMVGATVRLTPLAVRHWREEREGIILELSDEDAVVEYADGLRRTLPRADLVSAEAPPSVVGKMVVGDDEPEASA